jgi:excisionase family DNA binding protein
VIELETITEDLVSDDGVWLLRAGEVARLLGIGKTKTNEMLASGELPVVRIGRAVRVPRDLLQAWVQERTSAALNLERE